MTLVLNLQFLDCQTDEETRLLVTALGQMASYKPGLTKVFGFLKSFQLKRSGSSVNRSNASHNGGGQEVRLYEFCPAKVGPVEMCHA